MIKFGTSGFRGIIGDNWTKQNIQKIGNAIAKLIQKGKIVIGFDNRFMGKQSAHWLAQSLISDSIDIKLFDHPVPTPLITYKTMHDFDYGIMITASHNPYYFNGIMINVKGGIEASDAFYKSIEDNIADEIKTSEKKFLTISDTDDYTNKMLSLLDTNAIKSRKFKVLFNPMHGSSHDILLKSLKSLHINCDTINACPDPYFGSTLPAPYPHNLSAQSKQVCDGGYDFGFALDGDGDRFAFIDGDGKIYDCNYLMAALYYYLYNFKGQRGGLVKNYVSSNLAANLCQSYGQKVYQGAVGFKILGEMLSSTDAIVAGEGAGMAFKQVSLRKDGIFGTLATVDMLALSKKSIGQIIDQIILDTGFKTHLLEFAYKSDLQAFDIPKFDIPLKDTIFFDNSIKFCFDGGYWAAVRKSGTEPVVRLYVEMPSQKKANEMIKHLEEFYALTERQK
ncbi:MAG: hypothetical protein FWD86_03940 [Firmicutes bacterium]|nr:hypothetical protein [Bacillota bacterium]